MEQMSFKSKKNKVEDYVQILNSALHQLSYVFIADTLNNKILVANNDYMVIDEVQPKLDLNSCGTNQDENNHMYKLEFDVSDDVKIHVRVNESNLMIIEIDDKIKGKVGLVLEYKYDYYFENFTITSVLVRISTLSDKDYWYRVIYNVDDKLLSLEKSNYNLGEHYTVSMSSTNNSKNTLIFHTYNSNAGTEYKIESTGNDDDHRVHSQMALGEEPFNVKYTEKHADGKYIEVDLTNCEDFKHYSNKKLINSNNVRLFLDEFIENYKSRFPYFTYNDALFNNYLFDSYINGEPNNRKKADNFLKEVKFSIPESTHQRKKGKKIKGIK